MTLNIFNYEPSILRLHIYCIEKPQRSQEKLKILFWQIDALFLRSKMKMIFSNKISTNM